MKLPGRGLRMGSSGDARKQIPVKKVKNVVRGNNYGKYSGIQLFRVPGGAFRKTQ